MTARYWNLFGSGQAEASFTTHSVDGGGGMFSISVVEVRSLVRMEASVLLVTRG